MIVFHDHNIYFHFLPDTEIRQIDKQSINNTVRAISMILAIRILVSSQSSVLGVRLSPLLQHNL